ILRPLPLQLAVRSQAHPQGVAQVLDPRPADLPREALDSTSIDAVDLRRLPGRKTAGPGDLRPERVAEVPGQASQELDRVLPRSQEGARDDVRFYRLPA